MSEELKFALTVAGFDGCAGAGVLADVKAMAYFGVYAEAVLTALTEQNEDRFVNPGFCSSEKILNQLEILYQKRSFGFVKIGLVENAATLKMIVDFIRNKNPEAFIVWDPVASATAGFSFFKDCEAVDFLPVLKRLDLVTPNLHEYAILGIDRAVAEGRLNLGADFQILLKGGHSSGNEAVDVLWMKDGCRYEFSSPRVAFDKHGTGCNLSSAIVANMALGFDLPESCRRAKAYMDKFILSGEGRLGFLTR